MMASSGLIHEDKEQTAKHGCYYLQWLNPRGQRNIQNISKFQSFNTGILKWLNP